MSRHHIGMPHGIDSGNTFLQQSRDLIYEQLGFGSLGLITAVLQSNDNEARKMAEDWENCLLIRHQKVLWAYGYSKEERTEIYQHLDKLRAAGRYIEEFHASDRHNIDQ